jgi:hypothetical protein
VKIGGRAAGHSYEQEELFQDASPRDPQSGLARVAGGMQYHLHYPLQEVGLELAGQVVYTVTSVVGSAAEQKLSTPSGMRLFPVDQTHPF